MDCVVGGEIISVLQPFMNGQFEALNQQFGKANPKLTLNEFFKQVIDWFSKDADYQKLVGLKEEARELIDSIQNVITTDLETRFLVYWWRRLISAEK